MEVDEPIAAPAEAKTEEDMVIDAALEEEEDVEELEAALEKASTLSSNGSAEEASQVLSNMLQDTEKTGPKAIQVKERAVYDLTRSYCTSKNYNSVAEFLTGETGKVFLSQITKAKTAKVVRQVLDIVCDAAPDQLTMQESVARSIIAWTVAEKRSFLRQRVEAKLAGILYQQEKYTAALEMCDLLLSELKKLDDKQLLVETHLLESKIHFALRNVPKAKAALTASRTAANAIYVAPSLQADIDSMSGTIHTEEGDYNTAHSYFLEAFEQLDQMNAMTAATKALKYMMLCKILDSLRAALQLSSSGNVGMKASKAEVDLSGMISGKQGVKYAGPEIDAMTAIADAAANRDLKEFEVVLSKFPKQLQEDLLVSHHLHVLKEQLLESNLIRIIEPYSCVELEHIAKLIDMPLETVEKKLSQMILDDKFQGILDQGKGHLIVYEDTEKDRAMEKGLKVIANIDTVVTSLFERSKALRTMMI